MTEPANSRGSNAEIPAEISLTASQRPEDALVTLYNRINKEIHVPRADVSYWQEQGLFLSQVDIAAELSKFDMLIDNFVTAHKKYVEGVLSDGYIDTEDESWSFASTIAFRDLAINVDATRTAIGNLYEVRGNLPGDHPAAPPENRVPDDATNTIDSAGGN